MSEGEKKYNPEEEKNNQDKIEDKEFDPGTFVTEEEGGEREKDKEQENNKEIDNEQDGFNEEQENEEEDWFNQEDEKENKAQEEKEHNEEVDWFDEGAEDKKEAHKESEEQETEEEDWFNQEDEEQEDEQQDNKEYSKESKDFRQFLIKELEKEQEGEDIDTDEILERLYESDPEESQDIYEYIVKHFMRQDIRREALEKMNPEKVGVNIFVEILSRDESKELQEIAEEKLSSLLEASTDEDKERLMEEIAKRREELKEDYSEYNEQDEMFDQREYYQQNISEKRRPRDYWDEWEDWSKQNEVLEATAKPFIETGRRTSRMWERVDNWFDQRDKAMKDEKWYIKYPTQGAIRATKWTLGAIREIPARAVGGLAKFIVNLPRMWKDAMTFIWRLVEAVDKGGDMSGVWGYLDKKAKKKIDQYTGISEDINP